MNFSSILKKGVEGISKNSPTILTGIGILTMGAAVVFAVKATPKAMHIIEEIRAEKEYEEEPTKTEIVVKAGPVYIPTAIMMLLSASCMIGSTKISARRTAVLASLYSASEVALKEYQAKIIKSIGAKREQKVKDEIHQDRLDRNPVTGNQVIVTGKGDSLCYDGYSGRYFQTDIEKVRRAQNSINRDIISEMWVNVNGLYYELGLPPIKAGTDVGWDVDHMLDVRFSSLLADDGRPCLVIDYDVRPKTF